MKCKVGDMVEILSMDDVLNGYYEIGEIRKIVGIHHNSYMVEDKNVEGDYWFFTEEQVRKVQDVQTNE